MSSADNLFVLVRWVEDESFGVMPLSSVPPKEREDIYPGQFTRMKWRGKKLYEVEVLKVSGKGFFFRMHVLNIIYIVSHNFRQ